MGAFGLDSNDGRTLEYSASLLELPSLWEMLDKEMVGGWVIEDGVGLEHSFFDGSAWVSFLLGLE